MDIKDIRNLIAKMTLEEKAGLLSGEDFWHTKPVERLGVPRSMVSDGPHGLRKQDDQADHLGINESIKAVCFPAASATAASFDPELIEKMGEALGEACQHEKLSVLLGPAVNIKRSPLCGRNFEYFSEDPYLTGVMATALIKGIQSKNVGTSIKHFALNNQEHRRMSSSSDCDERTIRGPAFNGDPASRGREGSPAMDGHVLLQPDQRRVRLRESLAADGCTPEGMGLRGLCHV